MSPADVRREAVRLDQPREAGRRLSLPRTDPERFGVLAERFARWMGTAQFLLYMSVFVFAWLAWNTFMPTELQFDPRELNYTLLTLILSLQASYAAPLILLAQNRQDDRDRVALEQDRSRDERNLADTEYLTREVAALRIALRDMATRDFLRSELRDLVEELAQTPEPGCPRCGADPAGAAAAVPATTLKPEHRPKKNGKRAKSKSRKKAVSPDPMGEPARALLAEELGHPSPDPGDPPVSEPAGRPTTGEPRPHADPHPDGTAGAERSASTGATAYPSPPEG